MAKDKNLESDLDTDGGLDPDVLKGQPLSTALDTIVAAERRRIFRRTSQPSPSSLSSAMDTGNPFARSSGPSRPDAVPPPGVGKGTIFIASEKDPRGTITTAIRTIAGPPDDEQPSAKCPPLAEPRGVLGRLANMLSRRKLDY